MAHVRVSEVNCPALIGMVVVPEHGALPSAPDIVNVPVGSKTRTRTSDLSVSLTTTIPELETVTVTL
jgi:hypothetical protein